MEFWDIVKWVLITMLAIPVILLPLGIYAGFKLSTELFDIKAWIKLLKRPGVLKKAIVLTTIVIVLGGWFIQVRNDRDMYAEYISNQVSNDYRQLSQYILRNNTIYEEILRTERILVSHLSYLTVSNSYVGRTYSDYRSMAHQFNRIKYEDTMNIVSREAYNISAYFHKLAESIAEEHGIDLQRAGANRAFRLSEEDLRKIQLIWTLNDAWVDVIIENVSGTSKRLVRGRDYINSYYDEKYWKTAVKDSFWSDVVMELYQETEDFLERYNITSGGWLTE